MNSLFIDMLDNITVNKKTHRIFYERGLIPSFLHVWQNDNVPFVFVDWNKHIWSEHMHQMSEKLQRASQSVRTKLCDDNN